MALVQLTVTQGSQTVNIDLYKQRNQLKIDLCIEMSSWNDIETFKIVQMSKNIANEVIKIEKIHANCDAHPSSDQVLRH